MVEAYTLHSVATNGFDSIFSVVGVILFLICLIACVAGKLQGLSSVFILTIVLGIFVNGCEKDPDDYAKLTGKDELTPFVYFDGKWQNEVDLRKEGILYPRSGEEPYKDKHMYRINTNFIPSRLFNPDSLYVAPGCAFVVGLICNPFIAMALYLGGTVYQNRNS